MMEGVSEGGCLLCEGECVAETSVECVSDDSVKLPLITSEVSTRESSSERFIRDRSREDEIKGRERLAILRKERT